MFCSQLALKGAASPSPVPAAKPGDFVYSGLWNDLNRNCNEDRLSERRNPGQGALITSFMSDAFYLPRRASGENA